MTLVYDDRGHLIFAQVYRHKYYIATDQCGTPVMVFNQYGEGIREIMRSPYGHIVYDSNPYLYLPVDFCGGLIDQVITVTLFLLGSMQWDGLLDFGMRREGNFKRFGKLRDKPKLKTVFL